MLRLRTVSRYLRAGSNHTWWLQSSQVDHQFISSYQSSLVSPSKASVCSGSYLSASNLFNGFRHQIHLGATSHLEEQSDPFSLVADELSLVANRLRDMVVAEVPKLASAAEYFFKLGVEGKRFRPTSVVKEVQDAPRRRIPGS